MALVRMVETKLWTDAKVQALTQAEKLLFVYLITNQHAHLSGLYYLPQRLMEDELGLQRMNWAATWQHFLDLNLAKYDHQERLVWVCKMYRHQGRGPKVIRAVESQLRTLHHSDLVTQFAAMYGFTEVIDNPGSSDRVSEPLRYPSDSLTTPTPIPIPNPKRGVVGGRLAEADAQWLAELRENPIYRHVDFDTELGKMDLWLALPKNKHRKKTREFILRWINKIEHGMASNDQRQDAVTTAFLKGEKYDAR
jgi:hypothetical protein